MQVSVAGLRRNIKNIANNYTEPQKKVREATSNDPWGTPSTLMSEIADMTYNIEAFAQIMEMIWKRLNDHGKNWRHVYKSLVLLEYLIKTGSERVAQQCKENIFAIQTLKDFQYFEDNKDQGLNVREKAKQLVTLLSSEERLKNERARALKARERFAQTVSGFGSSDSNDTTPTSPVFTSNNFGGEGNYAGAGSYTRQRTNSELEKARPETAGEEELQLQLALAMSKEEAEQEEKRRRSDDLRLQMALSQSEQEFRVTGPVEKKQNVSALLDLLDVELSSQEPLQIPGATGDPWAPTPVRGDPWSGSNSAVTSPLDPWNPSAAASSHSAPNTAAVASNDPWLTTSIPPPKQDPWGASPTATTPTFGVAGGLGGLEEDEFDTISKRPGLLSESSVFNMEHLSSSILQPTSSNNVSPALGQPGSSKKTPVGFLGQNSSLVDLDNLLPSASNNRQASSPILGLGSGGVGGLSSGISSSSAPNVHNPFAPVGQATSLLTTGSASQTPNPFHIQTAVSKPTINELREKQQQQQMQGGLNTSVTGFTSQLPLIQPSPVSAAAAAQNNPWSPVKAENPFLPN